MTNCKLLYEQVRQNPDDTTLLGAWADCLQENGDDRAGMVRDLMVVTESLNRIIESGQYVGEVFEILYSRQKRLQWRLRLTTIQAGDPLTCDTEGRMMPMLGLRVPCYALAREQVGDDAIRVVIRHSAPDLEVVVTLGERCRPFE